MVVGCCHGPDPEGSLHQRCRRRDRRRLRHGRGHGRPGKGNSNVDGVHHVVWSDLALVGQVTSEVVVAEVWLGLGLAGRQGPRPEPGIGADALV